MQNLELSWMLQEIADLMEIKGDSFYKIRAFRKAAQAVETLPETVSKVAEEGRLQTIPGIGKGLRAVIEEWLAAGSVGLADQLRTEIPPGVIEFLRIPGLGAKTARSLHRNLGVATIDELRTAAVERRIRTLRGMGSKTEMMILRGIERYLNARGQLPAGIIWHTACQIKHALAEVTGVCKVELVGELRRFRETVTNLAFLVCAQSPHLVMSAFTKMPLVKEIKNLGDETASVILHSGVTATIEHVDVAYFAGRMQYLTGSSAHNEALETLAAAQSFCLQQGMAVYGSESEVYAKIGMPFIPPELREGRGEVQAALNGTLPELITESDIRSDLHMHTTASDGIHSIKDMARAAREQGREYIAICDHSRSLVVANGLTAKQLQQQAVEIDDVASELGFPILKGVECDILADGSLDYDDHTLAALDIVIASVHTGFQQEEHKLTDRIIKAIENPHVDVIAHPTGRLLGYREPYAVDIDAVIDAAAEHGTMLEINASPERLDLADTYARRAKDKGVRLAINTDAHSIQQQTYMQFGVSLGRRAWLERSDVANTWGISELLDFVGRNA